MFEYFIENGKFSIPVKNFKDIDISSNIEPGKAHTLAKYPDGLEIEIFQEPEFTRIISNREFILNDKGEYVLSTNS